MLGKIVISCNCEPFKYKKNITTFNLTEGTNTINNSRMTVYADLINVRINNEGCLIGTKNYIGATIGAFNTSIGPEETQYTVHFKNFESVDSIIEYEPVTNAREDYDISFGIDAYIIVGFNVNICFKQDEFIVKWEEACSSD